MPQSPPDRNIRRVLFVRVLLLVALLGSLAVLFGLHQAPPALAAITGSKSCVSEEGGSTATIGERVFCTINIDATNDEVTPLDTLSITAISNNFVFDTSAQAQSSEFDCQVVSGGGDCEIILPVSSTSFIVRCLATPPEVDDDTCDSIRITEVLVITGLNPNVITQRATVDGTNITLIASFTLVGAGRTFYVSTTGNDENNCTTRNINACATINRALEVARDEDTIFIVRGDYTLKETVAVNKLVTIEPESGEKVVLKGEPGITMFRITAQGGPNLHVTIRNFTIGGNYKEGSFAGVFELVDDNYTEISDNIIGAEDLPINNGIILSDSDHPNIARNVIQGNTRFNFTPLLEVGRNRTGFGVVTLECFGMVDADVSDSVTIANNLFTNLLIAGIWLCSDGGGEHSISTNVFRNNWRGVAFKDVTNSRISDNVLIDDRADGIIVYGASVRNTVERNTIESHVGVDAAAIRIGWAADGIQPLDNRVESNQIVRSTIGVHVYGARTTQIRNNEIKLTGFRTGVLLSSDDLTLYPGSQPRDTEISGNILVFTGACTGTQGCALRMFNVTVPVLATDNDWGVRRTNDVEGVIWHQHDDPRLGAVSFSPFRMQLMDPTPTPTPTLTPVATVPATDGPFNPTPTPFNGTTGTPTPLPGSTPTPTPSGSDPTPTPSAGSTPTPTPTAGPTSPSGRSMNFRPATINLGSVGASAVVTITGTGFPTSMLAMQALLQYDNTILTVDELNCTGVLEGGLVVGADTPNGMLIACAVLSPISATQGDLMTFRVTRRASGAATISFGLSGLATQYSTAGSGVEPGATNMLSVTGLGGSEVGAAVAQRAPNPTPTPRAYSISMLDDTSPCIPLGGQRQCDRTQGLLWTGDVGAWEERLSASRGGGPITPARAFDLTYEYRITMGDPAALATLSRGNNWPHVRIIGARYRGERADESDEWVLIWNMGGKAQDMSGWSVRLSANGRVWRFRDGFVLTPGYGCRFYTGTPGRDACPGTTEFSTPGGLPDQQGTISLWVDFLDFLGDQTSYSADPANQPPPPNLKGLR